MTGSVLPSPRSSCACVQGADPGARPGRFFLADDPADFVEAGLAQPSWSNGVVPVEQFVEQHAQGVDVAPRVDIQAAHLGLLRAHVQGRADQLAEAGEERLLGQLPADGLGDPEVDDLGHRHAVVERDHDVGRA